MSEKNGLEGVSVVGPNSPAQPQAPPQYYGTVPPPPNDPYPQPFSIDRQGKQEHVQDNLVISIVSIFFCCILGIVATIKASDSKDALQRGDIDSAQRDSALARKLAMAGIITGIVIIAIGIFVNFILPLIGVGVIWASHGN